MKAEILLQPVKIYQVHDRIYFQQEILFKSSEKECPRTLELQMVRSLFLEGAVLNKVEILPPGSGTVQDSRIELNLEKINRKTNIMKLDMEFIQSSEKFYYIVVSDLFNQKVQGNRCIFSFLVKNKKDWPIDYIKMNLEILTKKRPNELNLFRIELETNKKYLLRKVDNVFTLSWPDRFAGSEAKTYVLEAKFDEQADTSAQIDVYVNDSSLLKEETIAFVRGIMLEALQKFYELLSTMEGDLWWLERHLDTDCFTYLKDGINTKLIKKIRIVCSPIHVNDKFQRLYKAFKLDMEEKNVDVSLKVVLDESILRTLHGRFFFDDKKLYETAPSSIVSKKFDAVVPILGARASQYIRNEIKRIWENSTTISQWSKIQEKRKQLVEPGRL